MEEQAHPLETHDRYPIEALVGALTSDEPAQLLGADGPLLACVLSDLGRQLERTLLIITEDDARARDLARDMMLFMQDSADDAHAAEHLRTQEIVHFPEYDVGPYHQASPDRKLTMRRLGILHRLQSEHPPAAIVASVAAIARRTLPPEAMTRHTHVFSIEDEVDNDTLRSILVDCGYTEVPVVEDRGTFAIRGDIVDIFSPVDPYPVRLERWGDEVAEIRAFHPETQRTVEHLSRCTVFPVRQEILDEASVRLAQRRLHERGAELELPTAAINTQMADLRAGLHFIGIDAFLPALHDHLATILDYLGDEALPVFVRPNTALARLQELVDKRAEELDAVDDELFFPVDTYYLSPRELLDFGQSRPRVESRTVAITPEADELAFALPSESRSFSFRARENSDVVALRKSLQGPEQTLRAIAELIQDSWRHDYGRICFACRTPAQVERMVRMLQTLGIGAMSLPTPIDATEPIPPPAQVVEVYHAPMATGFRSTLRGLALITGAEVFGRRVTTRTDGGARQFAEQTAISHFRDLESGDHVVHVDFGIGRYLGLVHLDVDGIGNDFLQLEYADGDKLYLPVYRLGRVQKYIGASDHIRLDKLGGNGWERTKEKVKENIREIAGELLALYARREMARGITYSAPDDMYLAFEERFPFEETPDQARAIEETLRDMTNPRPMDRLICGDVGFGKTEVAIRAAMKAVLDARQVAVLVPTTILAEQHLISFTRRMEEFGVHVACLSRFRSSKDSREIIKATKEGKVDVLIGTHRLLSKEIEFANLGLLIVDEEQRFGVTHKERIKRMRSNIDVLTLSATPIPRTLQMSLLGIRDLSIIATPPHDRLAVRTHVAKFSDAIVREAVMRELGRGGQVFFVHNRVATIEEIATHLRELVPEARIGIGHGQMPETKLEDVMLSYLRGDINVLLASSIIESGLDIPNANTIIINRADMFGLSQLYQLRGRVGRGTERAYAYLLIPNRAKLKKDAEKRLDVIQTHTELGSGFHVASYDLEIRGSGNLLGEDQSGHVTAVGLDLYNELLEEAVNDLRGEDADQDVDPEVNIPVTTYLPDDYIPATSLRLMFYKRFSLARSLEDLHDIYNEMVDRFGQPPESVLNLREIVAIKIGLRDMRAHRLDAGPSAISIDLDTRTTLDPNAIVSLVKETRGKLRLTEDMKLIYKLKPDESAKPMETSRALVDLLLSTM